MGGSGKSTDMLNGNSHIIVKCWCEANTERKYQNLNLWLEKSKDFKMRVKLSLCIVGLHV